MNAPFPYFGGKREIAAEIWTRFGRVDNYVEPFAGSLAVLLARPDEPKVETVNDLDGLLVNFWRAVAADPEAVARWADWPVSEADLHPRHYHLVARRDELTERLIGDADYFDAKLAGWWVWGACQWIGSGWCSGEGPWRVKGGRLSKGTDLEGAGISRQIPHIARPRSTASGVHQKIDIPKWFARLRDRLRHVTIACGDFRRVLSPGIFQHGKAAVFLDPPYAVGSDLYSTAPGAEDSRAWLAEWCVANAEALRIAICGHAGEYNLPGWEAMPWKASGGYGNQGGEDADDNRHRETIWFSPACLRLDTMPLFADL